MTVELTPVSPILMTKEAAALGADERPAMLLVIAGEAEWSAAVAVGSRTVLSVGLRSAGDWLAESGAPHPDLRKAVRADRTTQAVIVFPGIETNAVVYDQAFALGSYLARLGARKVSYARLGAMNVALELGTLGDDEPAKLDYLELLSISAGTIGRRPAAAKAAASSKRLSIAPTVDMETGQIFTGTEEGRIVLMEASARRIRTVTIQDDLKDPGANNVQHIHDLEVTVMTAGVLRSYEVPGVRDADLGTPRRWLNRVPSGTSIAVAPGPQSRELIEAAVRAHEADLVIESMAFRRTGWKEVSGRWGYLSSAGFHTSEGLSDVAVSMLSARMSHIAFPDTIDRTREVEAAKNTAQALGDLDLTNLAIGPWGAIVHNLAGLGRGGAGAVVAMYGFKGCGKTSVLKFLAAHASRFFAEIPMATIDGSVSNLGRLGGGLESGFICIDDIRTRTTQKQAEAEAEGTERIIRMGYAGGSARYTPAEYNQVTQEWGEGTPDLASPLVIISGEVLPAGDDHGASSRERIYPVGIPKGLQIFESGNARKLVEMSTNGLPEVHTAFLLRWVAEEIEKLGGMDAWVARWTKLEQEHADSMKNLPVSVRVREVAAVIWTGIEIWGAYLISIGVLQPADAKDLTTIAETTVRANALEHGTVNVQTNDGAEYEAVLEVLRAAVVSHTGYLQLEGWTPDDWEGEWTQEGVAIEINRLQTSQKGSFSSRLIGVQKEGRATAAGAAVAFLAMQPSDVLAVVRHDPRFRTLTASALLKMFEDVSLKDGGKLYKMVVLNSVRVKTLSIPMSVWNGTEDAATANDTEMAA